MLPSRPQESNQLHLVYRPSDSNVTSFVDELPDKFERDIIKPGQITLLGDFNIKMNKPEDADTIIFSDFPDSLGLENRVKYTTYHMDNTIDLIITQENSSHVSNIVKNTLLSDHYPILFIISSTIAVPTHKKITYRKIKKIDKDAFRYILKKQGKLIKYLKMVYKKISTYI